MKILHVVTYVSDDGAYGGPVRVARAQARALADRGHDVLLLAGGDVSDRRCRKVDGYTLVQHPIRSLPGTKKFSGYRSPDLQRELRAAISTVDVAHLHLARDLVMLPAALVARHARKPYVVQPHGMVRTADRPLARVLDGVATKRVLRSADRVLALTDDEHEQLRGVSSDLRVDRIANGVRLEETPKYEGRLPRVLFLARLQARKRPVEFVQAADLVAALRPDIEFVLAGPDGGEGQKVEAAIRGARNGDRIRWIGAVSPDDTAELLAQSAVYVLPSVNEVFPMSLLEAFGAGTPSVVTDSLGIGEACRQYGAIVETDGSVTGMAEGIMRVLDDPEEIARLRAGAREYLRCEVNIDKVAAELEATYRAAIDRR